MRTDTTRQLLHLALVALGAMIITVLLGVIWDIANNDPTPFAITAIRDTWTFLAELASATLGVIA